MQYKIANKNIAELSDLEAKDTIEYFRNLKSVLPKNEYDIASEIIKSSISKINAIAKLGIGYLCINRSTLTLSGGEGRTRGITRGDGHDLASAEGVSLASDGGESALSG